MLPVTYNDPKSSLWKLRQAASRQLITALQGLIAVRFGGINVRLSVSYELDQGSTVGKIRLNATHAVGTAGCLDCSVRTSRPLDLGRGPHGPHGSVGSIRVV